MYFCQKNYIVYILWINQHFSIDGTLAKDSYFPCQPLFLSPRIVETAKTKTVNNSRESRLASILPTFYEQLLRQSSFAEKLQSQTVIIEKLQKGLKYKKVDEINTYTYCYGSLYSLTVSLWVGQRGSASIIGFDASLQHVLLLLLLLLLLFLLLLLLLL